MYRTGYVASDLAAHIIAPLLYAYEGVPSTLDRDQIAAVLETTKRDTSPVGLRDYAILQLLATYGMRSGEIRNLTIEDIEWRAESLRVRHSKDRCVLVPAIDGAGRRSVRSSICAADAQRRTGERSSSGRVRPIGPCGISTVTSAVGCWRLASIRRGNAVPTSSAMPGRSSCCARRCRKRSSATCSAIDRPRRRSPILKLATEDLRAIALDVPGSEVLA